VGKAVPRAAGVVLNKDQEQELIDKARGGDASSFSALVELYQERAIHTANSFLGNFEDARDIAQEAFVKAYENLDSFKRESKFYTWFYRILLNHCKDFLRKKKLRRTFSFFFSTVEEEDLDPMANVPDGGRTPGEVMADRELGSALNGALEKLPVRQKIVFVLRYLEGLSLEDISESLSITVGAVKAHLWQAGQKMRTLLKDQWTEAS
jgi:RNA polymerase sigma-70 factor (ECF subfamily)